MGKNIAAVILAAGKGQRMKSELPKVLHSLCGRPLLGYVLDLVKALKIKTTVTVIGYKHEQVRAQIGRDIKVALQEKLLGTADAVRKALLLLKGFRGTILILYGDIPLLKKETVDKLIKRHCDVKAAATFLTTKMKNPQGYGRVLRDKYSMMCGIVEEKDADDFQKDIKEVNTGIACFDKDKLIRALKSVKLNKKKKEYYLTDVISILYSQNELIEAVGLVDVCEGMGINSQKELAKANRIMQQRINDELMDSGVNIIDPETTFIDYGVKIGRGTVIYPFTVVRKNVKIGNNCCIGPFVHLREDTQAKDNVTLGNFLEVARSRLDSGIFIKHFGYIGDARLGRSVNIGAGTVTANFDGKNKNKTVIGDGAFIGSDTILVAPVSIGKSAVTGAGAVVLKDSKVAAGEVVAGVPARLLKKRKGLA